MLDEAKNREVLYNSLDYVKFEDIKMKEYLKSLLFLIIVSIPLIIYLHTFWYFLFSSLMYKILFLIGTVIFVIYFLIFAIVAMNEIYWYKYGVLLTKKGIELPYEKKSIPYKNIKSIIISKEHIIIAYVDSTKTKRAPISTKRIGNVEEFIRILKAQTKDYPVMWQDAVQS